jgi:hypothetical protein
MGRQHKSLLTLKANLEQSIEKAELDCRPLELSHLKSCYSEVNRLSTLGQAASKEALEDVATSVSLLSNQNAPHNQEIERTAVGIRLLAATAKEALSYT